MNNVTEYQIQLRILGLQQIMIITDLVFCYVLLPTNNQNVITQSKGEDLYS